MCPLFVGKGYACPPRENGQHVCIFSIGEAENAGHVPSDMRVHEGALPLHGC